MRSSPPLSLLRGTSSPLLRSRCRLVHIGRSDRLAASDRSLEWSFTRPVKCCRDVSTVYSWQLVNVKLRGGGVDWRAECIL